MKEIDEVEIQVEIEEILTLLTVRDVPEDLVEEVEHRLDEMVKLPSFRRLVFRTNLAG